MAALEVDVSDAQMLELVISEVHQISVFLCSFVKISAPKNRIALYTNPLRSTG